MTTFTWILTATFAGGIVSVLGAWLIAARASAAQVPILISYAVGALLGAVFIELLPHAFTTSDNLHVTAATILGGLLLFLSSKNSCYGVTATSKTAKRTIRTRAISMAMPDMGTQHPRRWLWLTPMITAAAA